MVRSRPHISPRRLLCAFPFLHSSRCINRRFVSLRRLQNHQPSFKTLSAMWLCPERKRRTYVAPVARPLFFSRSMALPLHSHFLYHLIFPPLQFISSFVVSVPTSFPSTPFPLLHSFFNVFPFLVFFIWGWPYVYGLVPHERAVVGCNFKVE